MGQVLSAVQEYINTMWTTFTGPPRPALSGVISPKIKALMEGYKGGKSAILQDIPADAAPEHMFSEISVDMPQLPANFPTQPMFSSFKR